MRKDGRKFFFTHFIFSDPKFIPECTLPLTGKNVVDMVITDLAVFQRPDHSSPFRLLEMAPGVTAGEVASKTTAHYES